MSDNFETSNFHWNYLSRLPDGPLRARALKFIQDVDWQSLLKYAAKERNGVVATILPPIGLGLNHMVRIVQFIDGVRWVARLRMPPLDGGPYGSGTQTQMESEVCTASLVSRATVVPVARVYAYELIAQTSIGAPFMLLECLEGNVGMDLGMTVPPKHKGAFYGKLAEIHIALTTIRLPKIGKILAINDDGTFNQGPIPGIGGPFDTATEFFRAWAANAKFPMSEERLRVASGPFADEVVPAVSKFPKSIHELAHRLSRHDNGPFPLHHGDFGHNNIVVDNEYQVLGVIDWEAAYAAPWEVAGSLPLTLSTTPPAMDAPWNYDENGDPKSPELAEKFADQQRYIETLKEEERKSNLDGDACISSVWEDLKRQHVIAAMHYYAGGKAGFYSKVIDQFPAM